MTVSTPIIALALAFTVGCSSSPRSDDGHGSGEKNQSKPAPNHEEPTRMPTDTDECLARLTVNGNDSVLDEQRRVGPRADDFFEFYDAASIDPATFAPVEAVARYTIDQTPLMWFTPDKTAVVVDASALSRLTVADPTRMAPGERVEVGRLTERARDKITGRALVELLIHARAIATYWHIGAELCLRKETNAAGRYSASFTGEHTYFTNEKNVESFAFEVTISGDGSIVVSVPK